MTSFFRNNAGTLSGAAIGATLGGFVGGRTKKEPKKKTTSEKSDQKTDNQTSLRRRKIIRNAVLGGLTGALYGSGIDAELRHRKSFKDAHKAHDNWDDEWWDRYRQSWDDSSSGYQGGFPRVRIPDTREELWARLGGKGAPPTTKQEFKAAYRAAARKYHPDLNSGTAAEAAMKDLNETWDSVQGSPWFDKLASLLTDFWR